MKLQNFVKVVKTWCGDNNILKKYSVRYFRGVTNQVNEMESENEDQKISRCTGLVKVYSLRKIGVSQSHTSLACIMFHKIADIYRELKHQETLQASHAIKNL